MRRLAAGLVLAALAAAVPAAAQRYLTHRYTETEGLPSPSVRGVIQAPDGCLWFATRAGAARYDGFQWMLHNIDDGLPDSDVGRITVDDEGRLWTVARWGPVRVAYLEEDRWVALAATVNVAGSAEMTAFAVGGSRDRRFVAVGTGLSTLHVYAGSVWRSLTIEHERDDPGIDALAPHGDGLVVGTSAGLFLLDDPQAPPRRVAGASGGAVRWAAPDPDLGGTWVVGAGWIGMLRGDELEVLARDLVLEPFDDWPGYAAVGDRVGGLYFGNPTSMWHFSPGEGLQAFGRSNGLVADGVTDMFLDREDNLWIAGLRGVTKLVSRRFENHNGEAGLMTDEVSAVLELRSGEILLGHPRGLTRFGPPHRTLPIAGNPLRTRALDMVEDEQGTVWIAASDGGLLALRPDGTLRRERLHTGDDMVTSVAIDDRGRLWVSTNPAVLRMGPGGFESAAPVNNARRLVPAGGGGVYAATSNDGLWLLDSPGGNVHWTASGRGTANNVYAVHELPDGQVIVGTAAGLFRAIGGKLERATGPGPVIERPVYFIVIGPGDTLWFGTDHGVARWNGTDLRWFGVAEGLAGSETNRAAGVLDSGGRLWIGTDQGVSIYRVERDRPRRSAPEVQLLAMEASGEEHPADVPLTLPRERSTLVFHLRTIAFVDEQRVQFRHLLAGFDDGWQGPTPLPGRTLRYTNLPSGSYRLRLQAIDVNGRVSPEIVSAPIEIRRVLWTRGWFVTLVALGVLGLLSGAAAYVAQHRYARRLETEVEARTRELAKAQRLEALGLLAGGIAHDFNNLLTVVLGNLAMLERLEGETGARRVGRARAAALQAQRLTRQLLTFASGGAPVREAASLAEVVRESASFALSGAESSCALDLPDELWVVEIDEDQISQVMSNLLLNARQASPEGGTIRVRARNTDDPPGLPPGRWVVVEVADEGRGIPAEHLDRIFDPYFTTREGGSGLGLATAHSIVSRHEGRLTVETEPGRGSTFSIWLPASTRTVPPQRTPMPAAEPGAGRVLVMDDEVAVRSIIAEMLESYGYTVTGAADGAAALERYSEALERGVAFDAVIMDLTVPGGMGGKEAIRRLLEIDPGVVAIVVSGYSNDPVMARHAEHGFRARLDKPFSPDELVRTLGEVLSASRARTSS